MSRLDKLEEPCITKIVIVDCHGVTITTRDDAYNLETSVEVEYPTILTAHLGTQTRVCGNLNKHAERICDILTEPIRTSSDNTFENGMSVAELVRVLETGAVHGKTIFDKPRAVFMKGTPIKPKLPGESFQNVELFCTGVRLESCPERAPVGNIDGVWVCDLVEYSCTNVTKSMFMDGLTYDKNGVVNESDYDQTLGRYVITANSWLNSDGSPVTYRHLIERLNERPELYPIKNTAILLATCREFEDDDGHGDAVDSVGQEQQQQQPQPQQQQQPQPQEDDGFWISDFDDTLGDGKRRIKRKRGDSNKKRRYTKRKKYFKSSRKINKLKIKKRRTRKYKNKK